MIDKKMITAMTVAKSSQFTQNMEALPREATNVANVVSKIHFIYGILAFYFFFRSSVEESIPALT